LHFAAIAMVFLECGIVPRNEFLVQDRESGRLVGQLQHELVGATPWRVLDPCLHGPDFDFGFRLQRKVQHLPLVEDGGGADGDDQDRQDIEMAFFHDVPGNRGSPTARDFDRNAGEYSDSAKPRAGLGTKRGARLTRRGWRPSVRCRQ
jgi:hypothetical protein